MAVNRIKQVAKMFGKELGEEFFILSPFGIEKARFTHRGIEIYFPQEKTWMFTGKMNFLITGEAQIVEGEK
jgi:hypothetical protein